MDMNRINRLRKFVNSVNNNNSTNNTSNNSFLSENTTKFLPFFRPTSVLKNNNKEEIVVRVLPSKTNKDNSFFFNYHKHLINLGIGSMKQIVCFGKEDNSFEGYDNCHCPLCDFINDNGDELGKHPEIKKVFSKSFNMIYVYNYDTMEIQKYETSDFGLSNIITHMLTLADNNDDFNPEETGFDIVFRMESFANNPSNKFAKCVGANISNMSVDEVFINAKNSNGMTIDTITPMEKEILPYSQKATFKYINNNVIDIVNAMFPSYSDDIHHYLYNIDNDGVEETTTINSHTDSVINDNDSLSGYDYTNFSINEEDNNPSSMPTTASNEDEDDVSDIRAFLNNRR